MHAERAWHNIDRAGRRAHLAATGEAEIDFGAVRVAVVRADLAGLPTRDGVIAHLAAADLELGENFLDVLLGIPLLLLADIEHLHVRLLDFLWDFLWNFD